MRVQHAAKKAFQIILLLGVAGLHARAAESVNPYANETREERDARMAEWRDARFGMFIHWGVYAVPAGTYKGERIPGNGEWIMSKAKIPVREYTAYARQFNPVRYDPEAWVALAKRAGMRYLVITSKHHDGFALFPSAVTDWDVADATPYGRDLIGPLAEAARDEGLLFGLYYSQAQDWHHPGGAKGHAKKEEEGWDEAQLGDFDHYLKQIAAPQLGEILSRYRPDILWWDTPARMTKDRADRLLPLIRIVPGIITNSRLGGGYDGDTTTKEQHIPGTGLDDLDWEVCMTMNRTWGYKSYDHDWKSAGNLIKKLCEIVSKGGNFLLNVGPTAEGEIPRPSIERLEQMGAWMDVNSESIYGTTASPFHRLTWGHCTVKPRNDGTGLYLLVEDWPQDGRLIVPGLKNSPVSATILASGEKLSARSEEGSLVIMVPENAPDPTVSVIKLEIAGKPDIEAVMPGQKEDGSVELTPAFADLHNRGYQEEIRLEEKHGRTTIGNWVLERAWMGWTFKVDRTGSFRVLAEIAAPSDSNLTVGLQGADPSAYRVHSTGGIDEFAMQELGEISIATPGVYQLELRPVRGKWSPVSVDRVILQPLRR